MTVQNIINEVNSIQTKKKAIKDAITAKGVTSEGKLSKFADEINKITTKEPDWYIVNKFRYENGNEALYVRTSDKDAIKANKYQMVEIGGGVTKDNDINSSFDTSYNNELGITNGSYFPRETAYRSFTTEDSSNVVFNGHNDNLKLRFRNGKEIVFNDVNVYNWLKGYKNQPLADYNTLYLKSDGFSERNPKNLSDFLAPTNKSTTLTVGIFGATPFLLIDSTIMLQAMNLGKMSKIGFISYSDKAVDTISLAPVYYANNEIYAPFYSDKERYYGNLSPGNYVQLFKNGWLFIVFISVNYVIDSNGQKHKNIEVCIYKITKRDSPNIDVSKVDNKPFELYLTFSSQARQRLQEASSIKVFRRQVLAANGTPEPRVSNFLIGQDALITYEGTKKLIVTTVIKNLFRQNNDGISVEYRVVGQGTKLRVDYEGYTTLIHNQMLADIYESNKKVTGFIRIGEDMSHIELQKITTPVTSNDIRFTRTGANNFIFLPKGIGLSPAENKAMFLIKINNDLTRDAYTIKKSDNTEISIASYPADKSVPVSLYLTTDVETQNYIKSKPLTTIWTEIQDVLAHKDDYEAYYEV